MNRNVVKTMNEIFDLLKTHVDEEYLGRIPDIKRHITVSSNEENDTFNFVKASKIVSDVAMPILGVIYENEKYVLFPDCYCSMIESLKIGEILVYNNESNGNADNYIINGMGMLAMANGILQLKKEVDSLKIFNECLGVKDNNSQNISFPFETIKSFFVDYCVIRLDSRTFDINYKEDFDRFVTLMSLSELEITDTIKNQLCSLLLLNSSRSIAMSIYNSISNNKWEYRFLQLYHCLEYLFVITSARDVISRYKIATPAAIDISIDKIPHDNEKDRLLAVIKNANQTAIDSYYSILPTSSSEPRLCPELARLCPVLSSPVSETHLKTVCSDIYKIRCGIAHFRFAQDPYIDNIDKKTIYERVVEIVLSIYENLDIIIQDYCKIKKTWKSTNLKEKL